MEIEYIQEVSYNFDPPYNPQAWINHYYTKTIDEFCNKLEKGNVHFSKDNPDYLSKIKNKIKLFLYFNSITLDKLNKLEKCSGINLEQYKDRIK